MCRARATPEYRPGSSGSLVRRWSDGQRLTQARDDALFAIALRDHGVRARDVTRGRVRRIVRTREWDHRRRARRLANLAQSVRAAAIEEVEIDENGRRVVRGDILAVDLVTGRHDRQTRLRQDLPQIRKEHELRFDHVRAQYGHLDHQAASDSIDGDA